MANITKEQISTRLGLAEAIVAILDEKQARRIKLLEVENQTSLTNYFVICEGRSSTHINALGDELTDRLEKLGVPPLHTEGYDTGNWVALDYASVIVHVFTPNEREFYNLDSMWSDATEVDLTTILDEAEGD